MRLNPALIASLVCILTACGGGGGKASTANSTPVARTSKFIYVVSGSGGSPNVSVCPVDASTGAITTCTDAGGGTVFNGIPLSGMVLNRSGSVAYLNNTNGDPATPYVYQCTINSSTGAFSACTRTSITSPGNFDPYYSSIALNPDDTIAYVSDYNNGVGRILACPIANNTISGNCVDTGAVVSYFAPGLVLNKAGTTAYIGNDVTPAGVTVCTVSGNTFSSCSQIAGGTLSNSSSFSLIGGVGGLALSFSEDVLYISDNVGGQIYKCPTPAAGMTAFSNCVIATSSISFPWALATNEKNTMAYVTDYGTNTYTCPINADGTFGSCTTLSGVSAPNALAIGY